MKKIIDMIPSGRGNAIAKMDIARVLKISERTVREKIEILRQRGLCICVDTYIGGYYIPANEKEATDYLGMEVSRMKTIINNTKNLIKIFNKQYKNLNYELPL